MKRRSYVRHGYLDGRDREKKGDPVIPKQPNVTKIVPQLESVLGDKLVRQAAIVVLTDDGKQYIFHLADRMTPEDPEEWKWDEAFYFALGGVLSQSDYLWCRGVPVELVHMLARIIVDLTKEQLKDEQGLREAYEKALQSLGGGELPQA